MILCLDPGEKKAGCALFDDKELTFAWLAEGNTWIETADAVIEGIPVNACVISTVVIERMVVRPNSPPPKDLVTLSLMAGRVTGALRFTRDVVEYTPNTWKGSIPKEIMLERIRKRLSPEELLRVEKPSTKKKTLDVYDAIGIGLFHVRRRR